MMKHVLLAGILVIGSAVGAAAQSSSGGGAASPGSPSTSNMGSSTAGPARVSAETHCLDQQTKQPRLKTATGGPSGAATTTNPSANTGSGPAAGQPGTTGSGAMNLPSC
jgi:hypothetical protein